MDIPTLESIVNFLTNPWVLVSASVIYTSIGATAIYLLHRKVESQRQEIENYEEGLKILLESAKSDEGRLFYQGSLDIIKAAKASW